MLKGFALQTIEVAAKLALGGAVLILVLILHNACQSLFPAREARRPVSYYGPPCMSI